MPADALSDPPSPSTYSSTSGWITSSGSMSKRSMDPPRPSTYSSKATKILGNKTLSPDDTPQSAVVARAKNALLAVNFFVETNRMEPFVAVYFITFKHWNEVWIGIISLVMNMTMLTIQTPVGDLLDKTSRKREVTAAAVFTAAGTTVAVVCSDNCWVILFVKALEGAAATIFLPALMSLLLGIAPSKEEVPRLVASNEVSNKVGSVLFTLGCGLLAYFTFPDIQSMFYLLGSGGVLAAIFVILIPASAIDDNRARQMEEAKDEREGSKATATGYCTLLKDRNIAMFALLTFVYHLANAGVVPLVAQYIAIEDPKASMVFTSAVLLLFYAAQAVTAYIMKTAVGLFKPKTLLALAHLVLPIRCGILALLIQFADNKYAICATQLLDGIGAGIYDTMIPIVVSRLTQDTGRFGFTYGFIVTCWRIGHGFSFLLAESMVHAASYQTAFLIQGSIAIFSLCILILAVRVPEQKEASAKTKEAEMVEVGEAQHQTDGRAVVEITRVDVC